MAGSLFADRLPAACLRLLLLLLVSACSAESPAGDGPGLSASGGSVGTEPAAGEGGAVGNGGATSAAGIGGTDGPGGAGSGGATGGASGGGASGSGGSSGAGGPAGDAGVSGASGSAGRPPVGGTGASGSGDCDRDLVLCIRDFQSSHPDFEFYMWLMVMPDLVLPDLGPDHKPVYAHPGGTLVTTGPNEFAQWYNDVPGVNQCIEVTITLTEQSPGLFVYDSSAFFPVDGQGFGNEGNPHNFHFTTELHTEFTYRGGELFTFTGDDDLYLFINNRLALDLGGTHPRISGTVDLDAQASTLGIAIGNTYPMDIFHAERHTTESNFRIETTIECIKVVILE
jgi:fibro-slime domain-containing protein